MANDYTAKAIIETAQATKDLTALGNAVTSAGSSFAILDKQLKGSNTSLKDAAAALKSVVESTRQGAIAAKAMADAELKQAQASGTAAKNEANLALANQRTATSASQGALAETRKALALEASTRAAQRATEATERHTASGQRAAASAQTRAAAEQRAAQASLEVTDHLSNSRYLLYDVAATYQMLSTAMLAIPAAATAVAISYERDMAQVIRTNDAIWGSTEGIENMKSSLKNLATEIPTSFGELANIASLGGQLGITGDKITAFTETVAKFGAASNVTTEQAATAFGRLEKTFPDDAKAADFFNKIGSAIAFVGVKSVATESEIIAVLNQIAPMGNLAGFTADNMVGLAGAMASVRLRPELTRGAFMKTITQLNNAADEGATSFETYSRFMGLSGAEAIKLYKTDPSKFFVDFIGGLKGATEAGQSMTSVLADLGIKEVRQQDFLIKLTNGYEGLAEQMGNSSQAYKEGTFLDESTAGVFSTVSAELTKLANSFKNLGDTLGGGSMNLLGEFLRLIGGVVKGISDLASENKGVLLFINSFLGVGAVIGVLLAFKAAQAAALAAVVAYRQVVGAAITSSISFSGVLKELATTMYMARGATLAESQAVTQNTNALRAMTGAALGASAATTATGTAAGAATGRIAGMAVATRGAGSAMLGLVGGPIGALILGVGLLGASFFAAGAEAKAAGKLMAEGMAAGAAEGNKAISEFLLATTVGVNKTGASFFGDMGKNIGELGKQAGVSMEAMVAAVNKGDGALAEIDKTLDQIARSKNFDSLKAWQDADNAGFGGFDQHLNNLKDIRAAIEIASESAAKGKDNMELLAEGTGKAGDAAAQANPLLDENGNLINEVGESADDAASKVTNFIDALFGLVNAEAATQASLEKLGAGLQNSTSFSTGDSDGRDNLAALQETMRNAALLQQQMIDSGEQSAAQAQANYVAFIEGLYAELASRGVDVGAIQYLADQTKNVFNNAVTDEGAAATIPVTVDLDAVSQATDYLNQVLAYYGSLDLKILLQQEGGQQLVDDVQRMQAYILEVTGKPYVVPVDAEVEPATSKLTFVGGQASSITGTPWALSVDADTSPAINKLSALDAYAQSVAANANLQLSRSAPATGGDGWLPANSVLRRQAAPKATVPVPVAPTLVPRPVASPSISPQLGNSLGGLAKGYDNAAKAADKAGGAGDKAGKAMKDGIESAKDSLNDYVSRLKSGLSEAYDRQYGMASATDNYYKALNDINDKRKEDLKNIKDLIAAQKDLNNERKKDLVDANKAKIEKNISIKYGETDRAADYANQEQIALGNAAAKQKDIEANILNRKTLEQGMNALTGYSNAAIANRAALRDLESKMLDMITAYAATGKSQQQVAAYAAALGTKFKQQTGDIGYNRTAVNNLQGSMQRYINTVNSVPRTKPTTVTANTGGANSAIQGVKNNLASIPNSQAVRVAVTMSERDKGIMRAVGLMASGNAIAAIAIMSYYGLSSGGQVQGFATGGQVAGFSSGGQIPGKAPSDLSKDNRMAKVDGKGLIGIQSEEWVIQKAAVDHYGNDFMDDINNMRLPKFAAGGVPAGYSTGAGQASGDMIVALDAATMAKFAQFMNQPTNLYTSNELIASSAHEGGKILASKGVRW